MQVTDVRNTGFRLITSTSYFTKYTTYIPTHRVAPAVQGLSSIEQNNGYMVPVGVGIDKYTNQAIKIVWALDHQWQL